MADTTAKQLARAVRFKEGAEEFLTGLAKMIEARRDTVKDGLTFVDANLTGVAAHLSAADLTGLQSTIDVFISGQIPNGQTLGDHLTNITKVAGR